MLPQEALTLYITPFFIEYKCYDNIRLPSTIFMKNMRAELTHIKRHRREWEKEGETTLPFLFVISG